MRELNNCRNFLQTHTKCVYLNDIPENLSSFFIDKQKNNMRRGGANVWC